MSRLESQLKGGFYPCPDFAVDDVARRLKVPAGTFPTILDPCCGEGEAVLRLAEKLGQPPDSVWACELEETRSMAAASRLHGAHVLGLCDFTVAQVSSGAFSLLWLNPPFDDEIGGGGRVELTFLRHATSMLKKGGVLAFVCPEATVSNYDVKDHVLTHYKDVSVEPFPVECRFFREVVVMGTRRDGMVKANPNEWHEIVYKNRGRSYAVPGGEAPRRFLRGGLSDKEIFACLATSSLNAILAPPKPLPPPSPPLELARGQQALVLAGGMLDGVVQRPGEPPVLVKATPYKEEYVSSEAEEVRGSGDDEVTVTVRTTSERIKLKVRALTPDGRIKDLV